MCEHASFAAHVNVSRLTLEEGGPVVSYSADVHITCADCKEVFVFIGMEKGLMPDRPTTSVLGDEARLPIRPSSAKNAPLPALPAPTGFLIRERC